MAIGKTPLPALLRRYAHLAYRLDRTFRGRKAWPSRRIPSAFKKLEALSLRRPHSRKRNVKPVLTAQHNTVPRQLPTGLFMSRCPAGWLQGLGTSSLNRPAPPWPSGFSSSGRIAFSSAASRHGGLTTRRPAEVSAAPACCGATLTSSRRHVPGALAAATAAATCRARPSVARRLFTGYHSRELPGGHFAKACAKPS